HPALAAARRVRDVLAVLAGRDGPGGDRPVPGAPPAVDQHPVDAVLLDHLDAVPAIRRVAGPEHRRAAAGREGDGQHGGGARRDRSAAAAGHRRRSPAPGGGPSSPIAPVMRPRATTWPPASASTSNRASEPTAWVSAT